ncbi:hypothetical protein V6Z12_A05G334300 [Gossypium hirsutum]
MLLSSLGFSTLFAKNFQLALYSFRMPALFERIFKNVTTKLMAPKFAISITLFLVTLKILLSSLCISHSFALFGMSIVTPPTRIRHRNKVLGITGAYKIIIN